MASSYAVWTKFGLKDGMSKGFKKMGRAANGFGSVLRGILSANIIQSGFRKLGEGVSSFVTNASKIEDAVAGFTPLMGGVEKATQLVDRLNKEAATTPFQFEGIASVSKQLLPVMNGSIEKTADTFRMLGDTAGGNMQKLDSITRGYTKSLLKGKPDMESLNMIAEAGVPIFSEMSKTIGVTQAQFFELSKKGKLTNDQLTKTFQNMTKEGGIFFKGMEIASKTFTGKISTLKDNIALTAGAIGSTFMDVLKDGTDQLIKIASGVREWVTANQKLIKSKIGQFLNGVQKVFKAITPGITKIWKSIQGLIKTIGELVQLFFKGLIPGGKEATGIFDALATVISIVVNTASILLGVLKPLMPVIKTVGIAILGVVAAIKAWTVIQAVINFLIMANPIGLIITAIGALIAGIILLVQHWDTVSKAFVWFGNQVANVVMGALKGIGDFFSDLWKKVQGVLSIFQILGNFLTGVLTKAFEDLWKFIQPIVEGIGGFLGNVGGFFGDIGKGVGDFFGGVGDFFTGGGAKPPQAPNQSEVEARQSIQFEGNLNINGAPPGSTFNQKMNGAPPFRYELLGAQ